jgi:hypothetical protein
MNHVPLLLLHTHMYTHIMMSREERRKASYFSMAANEKEKLFLHFHPQPFLGNYKEIIKHIFVLPARIFGLPFRP